MDAQSREQWERGPWSPVPEELNELRAFVNAARPRAMPAHIAAYHLTSECGWNAETVGTTGPVYIVRFSGYQKDAARHATARELAEIREATRRDIRGHIAGERAMMAACPGGW